VLSSCSSCSCSSCSWSNDKSSSDEELVSLSCPSSSLSSLSSSSSSLFQSFACACFGACGFNKESVAKEGILILLLLLLLLLLFDKAKDENGKAVGVCCVLSHRGEDGCSVTIREQGCFNMVD
jgi:hypothetical protein